MEYNRERACCAVCCQSLSLSMVKAQPSACSCLFLSVQNISRSIVEATTPRDQSITVPRNPWQDRETQHERLVRQSSLVSSISGRSRPHTAGAALPLTPAHSRGNCSSACYGDTVQMWLRPDTITHNSCLLVSFGSHGWMMTTACCLQKLWEATVARRRLPGPAGSLQATLRRSGSL